MILVVRYRPTGYSCEASREGCTQRKRERETTRKCNTRFVFEEVFQDETLSPSALLLSEKTETRALLVLRNTCTLDVRGS